MIVAANPKSTIKFIPKSERESNIPDDKKAKFILQPPGLQTQMLMGDSSFRFRDLGSGNQVTEVTSGTQMLVVLRDCVKGWENIVDEKGKQIKFKDSTPEEIDESLSLIPTDIREEIFAFLKNPTKNTAS